MSARDLRQLVGELLHAAAEHVMPRPVELRPVVIPHPVTAARLAADGCSCANPYVAGGMETGCPVHGVPDWLQDEPRHGCTCHGEPRRDCPWHGVEPT